MSSPSSNAKSEIKGSPPGKKQLKKTNPKEKRFKRLDRVEILASTPKTVEAFYAYLAYNEPGCENHDKSMWFDSKAKELVHCEFLVDKKFKEASQVDFADWSTGPYYWYINTDDLDESSAGSVTHTLDYWNWFKQAERREEFADKFHK